MPEKKPTSDEIQRERDEPVAIPLDPEVALRALLNVDPESEPVADDAGPDRQSPNRR